MMRKKNLFVLSGKQQQVGWHMPEIPALRRLRGEDRKFKASLGYVVTARPVQAIIRLHLRKKIKEARKKTDKEKERKRIKGQRERKKEFETQCQAYNKNFKESHSIFPCSTGSLPRQKDICWRIFGKMESLSLNKQS